MREEVAAWLVSASQTLVDVAGVVSPVFLVGFALSIFRRTRPWTGAILYWFSFLAGAATWFYGAGITFASFGWVGLFVGLVLLGVGVVPMGVIGGLLEGGELAAMARGLLLMVVVTFLFRGVGVWLLRSGPATAQQLDRIRWLVGNRDGAERADRGPETEASADELIRRLEALPQRRAEDELTEDDSAPVISPEEAREWVSGTLHGSRVRLAECLRAEGRDQLYLIKPRGFPLSGWFRPNWLEDAQGRVYATRAAAQNAAGYSGFMGGSPRGKPIAPAPGRPINGIMGPSGRVRPRARWRGPRGPGRRGRRRPGRRPGRLPTTGAVCAATAGTPDTSSRSGRADRPCPGAGGRPTYGRRCDR